MNDKTDREKWNEFTKEMQDKGWVAQYGLWGLVAKWRHEKGAEADGETAWENWKRGHGTPPPF